jgi:hypothetical protein
MPCLATLTTVKRLTGDDDRTRLIVKWVDLAISTVEHGTAIGSCLVLSV